jgi:hypothetical protein
MAVPGVDGAVSIGESMVDNSESGLERRWAGVVTSEINVVGAGVGEDAEKGTSNSYSSLGNEGSLASGYIAARVSSCCCMSFMCCSRTLLRSSRASTSCRLRSRELWAARRFLFTRSVLISYIFTLHTFDH